MTNAQTARLFILIDVSNQVSFFSHKPMWLSYVDKKDSNLSRMQCSNNINTLADSLSLPSRTAKESKN